MQRVLLFLLVAMAAVQGLPLSAVYGAQTAPTVQVGSVEYTSVADWEAGTRTNLQITSNANGELRLANGTTGSFTAPTATATFTFTAVAAIWDADVPASTTLNLEVRAGPSADQLGEWLAFGASDARSQNTDSLALESVLPVPPSQVMQFRATFGSSAANASASLQDITVLYLNGTSGPRPAPSLSVPAAYGPATLTAAPRIVPRTSWGAPASNGALARQQPKGILLHQIGNNSVGDNPMPFLRATLAYHTDKLGWDDLPFHFVIDPTGTIYEGHAGGPTAAVPRLSGGDAVIHVALIGNNAPSDQQQATLTSLLAWLCQAYDIAPQDLHGATPGQGASFSRPNIATHNEAFVEASDPSQAVRDQVAALRKNVDQQIVRSRWYFAEGNTIDFQERLAVLNPGATPANVRLRLMRSPGPEVIRTATVAPGARVDLVVNTIFSDTVDVPAIVEADTPIIAERYMDFGTDISSSIGVSQPTRVWYFAEGTTDNNARTYLLLFNPQNEEVSAAITYMQGDGVVKEQPAVRIPPQQRVVVTVNDTLKGIGFGTRVIASRPIVAERSMIFGPDSTATSGGFHTAPGVTSLARRWYFAEGTTQSPFQMSVLVLNPNQQATNVTATFQTPDGTFIQRKYAIPPTARLAINANEVVPELGVATTVEADRPIAVERALYWNNGNAGSVAAGAAEPAFTWRFADGRTSGEFQEYLLFNNPNKNQARVAVEFVLANGSKATQEIVMPGTSRYTMAVHQLYPGQQAISATVRATQPIVAERSLFKGAPTSADTKGGTSSIGWSAER